MSTSLEGLGATLPPPITYLLLQKVSPRVSPVSLGIGAIEPIVLVAGMKLNELVVSITRPPWTSDAPPTWIMPVIAAVGAYMIPSGVVTGASVHLAPTAAVGSNAQIWLVEATLMLNPPRIYILLPVSA